MSDARPGSDRPSSRKKITSIGMAIAAISPMLLWFSEWARENLWLALLAVVLWQLILVGLGFALDVWSELRNRFVKRVADRVQSSVKSQYVTHTLALERMSAVASRFRDISNTVSGKLAARQVFPTAILLVLCVLCAKFSTAAFLFVSLLAVAAVVDVAMRYFRIYKGWYGNNREEASEIVAWLRRDHRGGRGDDGPRRLFPKWTRTARSHTTVSSSDAAAPAGVRRHAFTTERA